MYVSAFLSVFIFATLFVSHPSFAFGDSPTVSTTAKYSTMAVICISGSRDIEHDRLVRKQCDWIMSKCGYRNRFGNWVSMCRRYNIYGRGETASGTQTTTLINHLRRIAREHTSVTLVAHNTPLGDTHDIWDFPLTPAQVHGAMEEYKRAMFWLACYGSETSAEGFPYIIPVDTADVLAGDATTAHKHNEPTDAQTQILNIMKGLTTQTIAKTCALDGNGGDLSVNDLRCLTNVGDYREPPAADATGTENIPSTNEDGTTSTDATSTNTTTGVSTGTTSSTTHTEMHSWVHCSYDCRSGDNALFESYTFEEYRDYSAEQCNGVNSGTIPAAITTELNKRCNDLYESYEGGCCGKCYLFLRKIRDPCGIIYDPSQLSSRRVGNNKLLFK